MIPHIDEDIRETIQRIIEGDDYSSVKINRPKDGYLLLYKLFNKDDFRISVESPFSHQRQECVDCKRGCQSIYCMDCSTFKCQKSMVKHLPFYTLEPIYICNHCTALSIFNIHRNLLFNKHNDSYTRFFFCVEELNKFLSFHGELSKTLHGNEASSYLFNDLMLLGLNTQMKNTIKKESRFPFSKCCYELNEVFINSLKTKEKVISNNTNIWKRIIIEPYEAYLGYIKEHVKVEKNKAIKLSHHERLMYNKLALQRDKSFKKWEQFENHMDILRQKIYGVRNYRNDSFDSYTNERYENFKGKYIDMNNFDNDKTIKRYLTNSEKAFFKKKANEVLNEFKKYLKLEKEYNGFVYMDNIEHDLVNYEGKGYLGLHFDKFESFNYQTLFSCREAEQCFVKTAELVSDFYELFYQIESKKTKIEHDLYHKLTNVMSKVEDDIGIDYELDDGISLKVELNVDLDDLALGKIEGINEDIKIENFEELQKKLNNL